MKRVVVLLLLLAACMRSVPKKETRQSDAVAEKRGIVGGLINQVAAPPPPTAHYAPIAENGFIDASRERVTTFSIDVDGASYANVRRFVSANQIPPPDAVRIEEMLNYFSYSYPPPTDGRPFAVTTEVAGCPWQSSHRLLRVGIQGKTLDGWKLAPNNLV